MIDPKDPLPVQVEKQAKIIEALISRAERGHEVSGSAYSLFKSAIALQGEVWEKTKDLEKALDTLGRASSELETAYQSQERIQKNLADAMVTMEGGFALFSDDGLQVWNEQFKKLLPDVEPLIEQNADFGEYLKAVSESRYVSHESGGFQNSWNRPGWESGSKQFSSIVIALRNDRWFQMSHRQTISGSIAVLQTEITDIVRENRREKDRLINQHAHFLQAAFDHMSLGICTFSSEGELLVHNDRFGDLLALPFSLLKKGTGFDRIVEYVERNITVEDQPRAAFPSWIKILRRGDAVRAKINRRDRVTLDLQIHSFPDGGFIVSIMDVTIETQAAETLRKLNETLEKRVKERTSELTKANQQLQIQYDEQAKTEDALRVAKEAAEEAHASKTRFLAAASHDLLQPINAAKLYISMLGDQNSRAAPKDIVARLSRSFESMESLLHALLDIARLDSAGPEFNVTQFNLKDTMVSLNEDLQPLAAEKGLSLRIVPSSRWVTSDQRYVRRCVQNLIVNAIQYTERGRVLVGCRTRGNSITIEVWDTGIGISKRDQKRIFEEFTRVSDNTREKGMGLGLSIVERACRHLGHPVTLRSKPGVGSVFAIKLPIASTGAARPQSPLIDEQSSGDLDLIVMIVENDPEVLFATSQILESWGASVLSADSTEGAVALMNEIGAPPDIILADYQLNGDDNGIETIRTLRQAAGVTIPAIIITADRSNALLQKSAEQAVTVLTKPVQLARLRALINWKTRNFSP